MKPAYLVILIGLFFYGCVEEPGKGSIAHIKQVTGAITDEVLNASGGKSGDWLTYGRDRSETRYAELDQITKENIGDLGLAWTLGLGTKRGIQTTPIVVDGILFATGPWSVVYAIDARTGQTIWTYDPKVPKERATDFCCGVINRGLAIYEGDLFLGTLDARLISLKAEDGAVNWSVNTRIDTTSIISITGAPRIANGKVLIGNGGAEFNARGYVSAFDTKTGDLDWRFFTVPGDPSKEAEHKDLVEAAKTWTGEWWKQGGGGTVWDAIVYDHELNQVIIGVGNGAHWNRQIRSPEGGDNLYLSSIVALDAETGDYKWHFQTTPGDTWDYTATQHIILRDMEVGGESKKVLMQAPKNGFFYILDRTDGSFISGDNYTYMNWAEGLDDVGRPKEREGARYEDGRSHWIAPSNLGGHNWHPMTYSKRTGLVYIPGLKEISSYQHLPQVEEGVAAALGAQISLSGKVYIPPVFDPNPEAPQPMMSSGELIAYDPIKQERVWSMPQPMRYNGGLLSTSSGLLMQADAEGFFRIRDDETGKVLWEYDIRSGGIASPVTYLVDGEQYITIFVGWGGVVGQSEKIAERIHPGTVYTFKLGGKAEAPEKLPAVEKAFTTLSTNAAPNHIGEGFNLYAQYCVGCHGNPGSGGGNIPDLTMSGNNVFDVYNNIVLEGQLLSEGMPNFGDLVSEEELEDIKSFVLYSAEAFRTGTDPMTYMTNLAKMQYLADTNPPERKNVQ